jgi:hypothetical protein
MGMDVNTVVLMDTVVMLRCYAQREGMDGSTAVLLADGKN